MKTNPVNDLATEDIHVLLKRFAVPAILSMLFNSVYNIVDQIFIGHGVGYLGNAATNVAFPLMTLCLSLALLLGAGCAAAMSLRIGEGKRELASYTFCNAFTISFLISMILSVLCCIFIDPLLILCGATETVFPYAKDYTSIIIWGFIFVMPTIVLNNSIRADQSPKYSMYTLLIGALLNVVLDPLFIFVWDMGVKGAAIATVISQLVSLIASMTYIKRYKHIDIKKEYFIPRWSICLNTISLGFSSFITQFGNVVAQTVMNNALRHYGELSVYGSDIALSALGLVMKFNLILISILVGIAIGQQPIVGFNYGAGNYKRVKDTFALSSKVATCIACIGWMIFMLFPKAVIGIFGEENALYNQFAVRCIRIYLALVFTAGFQIVAANFFQAIGKPIHSSLLTLSRQIIFLVPFILILPVFWGIDGILLSGAMTDLLTLVLSLVLIIKQMHVLSGMGCSKHK